jgi:hypothetical protein
MVGIDASVRETHPTLEYPLGSGRCIIATM